MSSKPPTNRLKKFTRRSSMGLIAAGIPSGIWAGAVEPELLSITRKEFTLPRWPQGLNGLRVAQLTDLHYRPGSDDKLLEKLVEKLKEEAPDLILLTGDFVNTDPSALPKMFKKLETITAPEGVIVSPGNHDRWYCSELMMRKEVESKGMTYLQNQGTMLNIRGDKVFINGLDSVWAGHPDPSGSWKGHLRDVPVLAMVHEPDPFEHLSKDYQIDLQLSGHTHGGQCRVPLIGYAPVKVKFGRKYTYGHFEENDSQLWVGRGLGTTGLRVRFACEPELVILTLRAA